MSFYPWNCIGARSLRSHSMWKKSASGTHHSLYCCSGQTPYTGAGFTNSSNSPCSAGSHSFYER